MDRETKSEIFSMRIQPTTKARLKLIAETLDVQLPELFTYGAFMVFSRATNPAEYLRLKSDFILMASQPPTNDS